MNAARHRRPAWPVLVGFLLLAASPVAADDPQIAHDQQIAQQLVLIHGLGASAAIWADVLPYLKNTFDVYTYELHGHGRTRPLDDATIAAEAAALAAWIDGHGLRDPVLVGHGIGGMIAMRHVLEHETGVRRLILIDAGPRQITGRDQRAAVVRNMREDYDRFVALQYLDVSKDERVQQRALDMALRTDSASFASLLLDSFDVNYSSLLRQLEIPVLVIASEAYLPVLGHEREYLDFYGFGFVRQLQFRRLAGTGHYLMLEKPTALASLIIVWLRSEDP
jgi:pimeloyl-ACP methyl ester carboxylesterase